MKLAILSDCRVPTVSVGGHGLGRVAWDVAAGLAKRHEVTFFAGPMSETVPGATMVAHDDERKRAEAWDSKDYDAILDISHAKDLPLLRPDLPVVAWILDGEARGKPRRSATSNTHDQSSYPGARIIPVGIDVDAVPYIEEKQRYLAFGSKIHPHKGVQDAVEVHVRQAVPVRFVGERFIDIALPDWRPPLLGRAYHEFIGKAIGFLAFGRGSQMGGNQMRGGTSRATLEAQATGTPVIVFDSTEEQVLSMRHCLTGFVVANALEAADAVQDLRYLSSRACREFVGDNHNLHHMVDAAEKLLRAAADGEVW